jgi:hypothetical protein
MSFRPLEVQTDGHHSKSLRSWSPSPHVTGILARKRFPQKPTTAPLARPPRACCERTAVGRAKLERGCPARTPLTALIPLEYNAAQKLRDPPGGIAGPLTWRRGWSPDLGSPTTCPGEGSMVAARGSSSARALVGSRS